MADMYDVEVMSYLQKLPQDQRVIFEMSWRAQRKDSTTALLLSLLWLFTGLAGIGRIYIGDIGMGLALLFIGPLTCYIWPLIDTFLIGGAVTNHNHRILMQLKASYPTQ